MRQDILLDIVREHQVPGAGMRFMQAAAIQWLEEHEVTPLAEADLLAMVRMIREGKPVQA